jgi:hypothetical protein
MYACKSLKMQGILCIEIYAQKCERDSIRGRRIFIGFPDKFAKPAFYAGLVSLDFTGDNRRGAPQSSIQCGDCYSTQKSVHNSGIRVSRRGRRNSTASTMGMEPFISGKTAGPASASPGQTPTCRVAASTESSGK